MAGRRYLLKTTESGRVPGSRNRTSGIWDKVKHQDLWLAAIMLILMVLVQSPARAQEHYDQLSDVGTGSLLAKSSAGYQGLLRLGSDFDIAVTGMMLKARVVQRFSNQTQDWLAATYVFPLPADSAVHGMRIRIGERIIEGVIKERQQAKQLFVKAKQEGKQAGLMAQERANLFTTQVANIAPGDTIEVAFEYLQTLHYESGEFSVRLPLTLTPRYIPGNRTGELSANGWSFPTDQVPDAPAVTPPQVAAVADPASHQARVSLVLTPGFDLAGVTSPFHDIRIKREQALYRIEPRQNPVVMNRDLVISWRPVAQQSPAAAVFTETRSLPGAASPARHALLMVMPPEAAFNDIIPPRELLIVIDTSGSMSGASIIQAKAAVLMALERLRPGDRFNLMEFNSSHRSLFSAPQMAEQHALQQARQFVQQLRANGGTEMRGALQSAFAAPADESFLQQVVFITDGSVGNEHALLALIHQQLGNRRLYTVGIGAAPNEFFMRKAAEFGRGSFAMIGSQQQVQAQMSALFDRIEKPVMTDLEVLVGNAKAEWFPQHIPDLYAGQPLVVHGRFSQWPDSIVVSGRFSGQRWQQRLQLQKPGSDQEETRGVATLWAREKVQALEDEGTRQGNRDLHRASILELGLSYGIVTRLTSFVAIAREVVRNPADALKQASVPNLMPEGSTRQPPSVGMPQTALGVHQQFMLGLISLLVALLLGCLKYSCHFSAIGFTASRRAKS